MYKPQLRTFLAVCDAGSFTGAAGNLFITPSAVVQQINTLERDLGVKLFNRSQGGVSLTAAGEFLRENALDYIRRSEDIRRELMSIHMEEHRICIGTSLFEKCRLLYELWVLFSQKESGYEIQMVNIIMGQTIPAKTDLIESVNSGIVWMNDWDFLKICDVPFAFAVPMGHPLAAREVITLADLEGARVLSLNRGEGPVISPILNTLRESRVNIAYPETANPAILWESSFHNSIVLVPACWHDILMNMKVIPCRWDHTIPYGIFYRTNPRQDVETFLAFVRETYDRNNPGEIIPVL